MPIEKSVAMVEEDEGVEMNEACFGAQVEENDDDKQHGDDNDNEPDEDDESKLDERDTRGVPIDEVTKHFRYRTHSSQLCFDFMVYVPFLVMFMFFFFNGRDVTGSYYVVRVIKDRVMGNELPTEHIEKHFEDIANSWDWGRWASYVMIPNIWDCSSAQFQNGRSVLSSQGQNHLVGAMRFRTLRVRNNSCSLNSHIFDSEEGIECFGQWGTSAQEKVNRSSFPNPVLYPNISLLDTFEPLNYKVLWPVEGCRIDSIVPLLQNTELRSLIENSTMTVGNDIWNTDTDFKELIITLSSSSEIDEIYINTHGLSNVFDPTSFTLFGTNSSGEFELADYEEQGWIPKETNRRIRIPIPLSLYDELRLSVSTIRADSIIETPEKPFLYRFQDCMHGGITGYVYGDVSLYHCGGYIIDVPFSSGCEAVQRLSNSLQSVNYPFYDNYATRYLSVEFFVYSIQMDTFTSVKLYNEVAPCGSWVNKWQIRTFKVYTDDVPTIIVLSMFLSFVLYFWVRFFLDWRSFYKGHPPGGRETRKKLLPYIIEFWNILEFANLVTFSVVFVIQFIWIAESQSYKFRLPYDDVYPENMELILNLYMMQVYANAVNTVITFLKFLKYVRLNSRLNVLSATISLKASDMVACLVIFVYVVLAYSLAGNALFGSALREYRTIGDSYSTLLRMLLGDFDYSSLKNENLFLAAIFFWTFVVIGLFLLLNFLVAILSEGFAAVSGQNADIPLDEQVTKAWTDIKRALRPSRLWLGIKMWLQGNSRHRLLISATIKMEDYQVLMEEVNVQGNEASKTSIFRAELPAFIGREEYDLLGKDFMDDVWDDVLYHWNLVQLNDKSTQDSDNVECVRSAVVDSMSNELDDIDNMWHKMLQLHEELNSLYSTLQSATST